MRVVVAFALVMVMLASCAAPPRDDSAVAHITAARLQRSPAVAIEADLVLPFTPVMLDALEHGIALTLDFAITADAQRATLRATRRLHVSYAPLAQQYVVADLDTGATRSFARRTQLLAAFDRVRLPMPSPWQDVPEGTTLRLVVALDRTALPGPLRLPALLSRDWRLETTAYRWSAGA